jgi:hypothetical protein
MKALESELTSEELARMCMTIMDAVFDKELTHTEAEIRLKEFEETYLKPRDNRDRVNFQLKFDRLEFMRVFYEYYKMNIRCTEYKIKYVQCLLAIVAAYNMTERYIAELCKDSAQIKVIEEEHATQTEKLIKDVDIGELMDTLSGLQSELTELLDFDEGFELMGYPKPKPL